MMAFLTSVSDWLGTTPLSLAIQNTVWAIPAIQSVHILAIAVVISSATLVGLRLLGVIGRDHPTAAYAGRFLPWIWPTLLVLLVTGSLLVVAEPSRSLTNPSFIAKMIMLLGAIAATLVLQQPLKKDGAFWELTAGRRATAKVLAVVTLSLWTLIIFAGRWIAYITVD